MNTSIYVKCYDLHLRLLKRKECKKISILVSIIIPVYNAEEFLSKCIESILFQTYENIEVILVNDGSTDKSRAICEKYAEIDKRITVLHQENQGPSIARNNGIKYSKGDFIQFVDADDQINCTMVEELLIASQEAIDLVLCGYKSVSKVDGKNIERVFVSHVKGCLLLSEFMCKFSSLFKKGLINSPCNKLYNTKLIKNNDIKFPVGIHNGEDLLFNVKYLKFCRCIYILNKPLYYYNHINNPHSLTKYYKTNFFENRKVVFKQVKELFVNSHKKTKENSIFLNNLYTSYLLQALSNLFHEYSYLTWQTKRTELKKIVCDDFVKANIRKFTPTNYQEKILKVFLKYKLITGIAIYFNTKFFLKKNFKRFFYFLKRINYNQKH